MDDETSRVLASYGAPAPTDDSCRLESRVSYESLAAGHDVMPRIQRAHRRVAAAASARILCVEDDRETAALLAEELVDRGFEIELAHDGRDALARMLQDAPDLVLCDISMPVMSGFELLQRLTALAPRFAHVPFIFLTALADRDDELRGRHLGADDYVTKPVDFDRLVAIIRARLARVVRATLSPLEVGLNDRETETLTWAARGKTSAEIAMILGLSKRTVDFHIDNARAKLGVATRIEAAIKAATGRLIEP